MAAEANMPLADSEELPSSSSFELIAGATLVLSPHTFCYGAAASSGAVASLLRQATPSIEELFALAKKIVALGLSVVADNYLPEIASLLTSPVLVAFFPEFAQ
eukprot:4540244-Prymnesium_polylepis.1